jgi:hypothetical protein
MWWDTYFTVYAYMNSVRTLVARTRVYTTFNMLTEEHNKTITHQTRLGAALQFAITLSGRTLKLFNLPASVPSETGIVFKKANTDGTSNLCVKD